MTIRIYIRGTEYNPMFKFRDYEDFKERRASGIDVPKDTDYVVEAYIDDNMIDAGNLFSVTIEKLKLRFGDF